MTSWTDRLAPWLRPERRPALADAVLEGAMAAAIEAARVEHALSDAPRWRPGDPLRLLLVGYLGTRNTGADVRVAEMVRQLQAVLGGPRGEGLELTVLTSDARLSAGYFPGVRQVKLEDVFPPFLYRETARHHGVVACEGSMFKSRFANALTTLMAGALGLAVARNQLAVGYGAEAGDMDPVLRALVARYCRGALVVCRNEPSRRILDELGVRTDVGTDTAWTFEPAPPDVGAALLRRAGWDGAAPVLVVCPVNPFWWPVRPALGKLLRERLLGGGDDTHYRSLYYHVFPDDARRRYEAYLDALASALAPFARERGAFLAIVGMERLDRAACEALASRLAGARLGTGVLVSDEHDMFELVSVLRRARWLVSSRYHAIVCTTAAGVPALGVSIDERIANLLADRRQGELVLDARDPELADRVAEGLARLEGAHDDLAAQVVGSLPGHLDAMARMGRTFEAEVAARFPGWPRRPGGASSRDYLPPLGPSVTQALEGPQEQR